MLRMSIRIRAHFDGRALIPHGPVDLPVNQDLEIEVTSSQTRATAGAAERLRRLKGCSGLLGQAGVQAGPPPPLTSLRREDLYEGRP